MINIKQRYKGGQNDKISFWLLRGFYPEFIKKVMRKEKMNIEVIWKRIQNNSGEIFHTKRGIPFTYHTGEKTFYFENTNCAIGKTTIERAIMVTDPTVVKLEKANIYGAPYVYGIITDKRIIG